jgi:hypothetical protein
MKIRNQLLYDFFWVIPRRLNSDAGELPKRNHITFRTRRKFEIKNTKPIIFLDVSTGIFQLLRRNSHIYPVL